jgi:hypothetical protein
MRKKYLLVFAVTVILLSCKKEEGTITSPPPPPVLLKDVEIQHLPSPYYHFEYDPAGKVVFASFASDFSRYDVIYNSNRISEMRNNILVNKDTLRYSYDNAGKINAVKYINGTGVYTILFFTYDGQKLIEVERDKRSGTGFVIDKTMKLSYYPDGNLKELTYHYLPFNGILEQTFSDRYEQYDNKINDDRFGLLLHSQFFDHLVLLPGAQLQKNNPGKETRSGDGINYVVDYTYTYNDRNLPLTKTGASTILNGTNAGQTFAANSSFSYY